MVSVPDPCYFEVLSVVRFCNFLLLLYSALLTFLLLFLLSFLLLQRRARNSQWHTPPWPPSMLLEQHSYRYSPIASLKPRAERSGAAQQYCSGACVTFQPPMGFGAFLSHFFPKQVCHSKKRSTQHTTAKSIQALPRTTAAG